MSEKGGWVYIVTNKPHGTLYIGVTADIARRTWEHREAVKVGFTQRYRLRFLVWCERHEDIVEAIAREKQLKKWLRAWKIALIEKTNPTWRPIEP